MLLAGSAVGAGTLARDIVSRQSERTSRLTVVHDLLCKRWVYEALRAGTSTSTMKLFSLGPRSRAGLPRQPIRGGAFTDPIKRKIETE